VAAAAGRAHLHPVARLREAAIIDQIPRHVVLAGVET
jgi:hypothetical protein